MGIRDRLKRRVGRALGRPAGGDPQSGAAGTEPRRRAVISEPPRASRRSELLRAEAGDTERGAGAGAEAASAPTAARTAAATDAYTATVHTPEGETLVFGLREGESVCEAADRAGIELPSSCRSGGCLVCCGRLLEGEVTMGEQYVLEEGDIDAGLRLLCCTRLRSDAVFLSHQEDAVRG